MLPGAARHGVDHLVAVKEYVAHGEAVRLQCGADVLLMLQWDNPSEAGNLPGKLFEYLGARRPILALGYEGGEMARIIRERGAGVCSSKPRVISAELMGWLQARRGRGAIRALSDSASSGLTREEQFRGLGTFLGQLNVKIRS